MAADSRRLAIDGGEPAFAAGPPTWPRPDDEVLASLEAAYADGSWGRYHGRYCEVLRQRLADQFGVQHAWLCSSGTIAVELALRGVRVGEEDEVILGAYDFPGNFRAIEAIGARPVLVDLAPGQWVINIGLVEDAISPQTKAILASHLHGSLVDMPRMNELARKHNIAVVEDACQVPGAVVAGRPAGSWGDAGVLSFGGSKLLTAGRGGAVLTDREDVLQRIKIYCERGNDAFPLSELQAAVLVPQLQKLAACTQMRRRAVETLLDQVKELAVMKTLVLPRDAGNQPAFYKLPFLIANNNDACDSPEFEQVRRKFIAAVKAEGIALDEGFRGFARRSGQRCRVIGDLAEARRAAAGTVVLHHPVLIETDETIVRVAQTLAEVAHKLLR